MYNRDGRVLDTDTLIDIIDSCDKLMITGDLNAKHPTWGANKDVNTARRKRMTIINGRDIAMYATDDTPRISSDVHSKSMFDF